MVANMINSAMFLAVGLAAVHLFAREIRFLHVTPRSASLSAAAGASVAYVFVHILPNLAEGQKTLIVTQFIPLGFAERHVYLIALIGFLTFYGLERSVSVAENQETNPNQFSQDPLSVFWMHITSFAVYNALIGYLMLHQEEPGTINRLFYFVAMGFHFLVNDHGLREHHKETYDSIGRWVLAGAVILGWAAGLFVQVHQAVVAVLFAFLAGSAIVNTLKEELPEGRESRFWAFALGAGIYSALLIIV
jgi:hypothetical protein